MLPFRRFASILAAGVLLFAAAFAQAQAYTSIVVFGDSLSDTGNDATLSAAAYTVNAQVPGPATGYNNGRFTDGLDTSPAARSYQGVWVEQLAALLAAKPVITNSLAGGTDYAYGFATTGTGTSVFAYGPGNALVFNVNNMQLQLSTYLATKPTITNKTLFVIWGGANDLLAATATNATQVVTAAVTNELTVMQQLIAAGATDFLVVNLPPLGLVPRNNGSATTSIPATQLSAAYDSALASGLATVPASNPGKTLNIFQLDTYTLFNTLVGPPIYKGFANVTASSQGNTTINPDTYLFWDDLHPTTYGHSLVAAAALTAIGTPIVTTTAVASSNTASNLNASVTLTASVASTSGVPMGTVTFYDGTTVLGSSLVFGSASPATASISVSTLAAGSHSLTAKFAGANGYTSTASTAVTQTVTAPAFSMTSPGQLTIKSGMSSTITLALNAVGGFTGTVGLSCGTLPAHFSCSVSPTSVTYPSATNAATVTIGTSTATSMLTAPVLGFHAQDIALATALFFPGLGFLTFVGSFRRRVGSVIGKRALLMLVCFVSLAAAAGLSGCSSAATPAANPNYVPIGNYTIPVISTIGGVATTTNVSVTID